MKAAGKKVDPKVEVEKKREQEEDKTANMKSP